MPIRQPRYSKEEFARRGDEIYDRDIRPKVEAEHHGEFVSIDIETGQWEMDPDRIAPGERLRSRIPDAQIWTTRVGYGYAVRLGGASLRRLP